MNVGRKLQLGTSSLVAQAGPALDPAEVRRPDQLARGSEVWVYFRRWHVGTVQRVIVVDPCKANHGSFRGNRAVVVIPAHGQRSGPLTVRRACAELILIPLASGSAPDDAHNRKEAQAVAEIVWRERADC